MRKVRCVSAVNRVSGDGGWNLRAIKLGFYAGTVNNVNFGSVGRFRITRASHFFAR
jgi:hypothetical protein